MKFNKKGAWSMQKLAGIILVVIVLLVIIAVFIPMIFDIGSDISDNNDALSSDFDGDSLKDFQDDCPCTYGSLEDDGCPSNYNDEEIQADKQKYNAGECQN